MIIVTILIAIIVFCTNKLREKRTEKRDKILKLKFGRVLGLSLVITFSFLMFIHLGVFAISGLISGNLPGLSFNLNFASIFGLIITTAFLTLFFMLSVPNLIVLGQFIILESTRTVVLIKEERTLEIYKSDKKIIIRNPDIANLEFHIRKVISDRDYEKLDYVKITTNDNNSVIITDLLTPINDYNGIASVYKGRKRTEIKKYYNKINCC
jgi:hypothetical protein